MFHIFAKHLYRFYVYKVENIKQERYRTEIIINYI